MRLLPVLGALVLVAMMASGARPCDPHPLIGNLGPGLVFVPFPAPVPTPGGHAATGAYVDNREYVFLGGPCSCPGPPLRGDSTWLYLETNGIAGLQRGGASSVLPCDQVGPLDTCDHDYAACQTANPDELIY